jgi:predicted heme/steroid binding protein
VCVVQCVMCETLPTVTKAQLALRNGQDKPQVWVAYKGMVYDVTGSRLWHRGTHYTHWAGQDLTDELADAPHTDQVFLKFKVVAKLAN